MKVLPLPCKWLDLRVARMTTKNGSSVSWKSPESIVHNEYFFAWYIDTQIKYLLFLQAGLPSQSSARKRSVKGFVACMQNRTELTLRLKTVWEVPVQYQINGWTNVPKGIITVSTNNLSSNKKLHFLFCFLTTDKGKIAFTVRLR